MYLDCVNNRSECRKEYDFEENAIFVWSLENNGICIGDEVFHDLMKDRSKREIIFGTFCSGMDDIYRRAGLHSAPFLRCQTFLSCYMSWLINWNVDYRSIEAIDNKCGHNPKKLACDGVHVGVSKKHLTHLADITKKGKNELKKPMHRRFDRTLIAGQKSKKNPNITQLRKYMINFDLDFRGKKPKGKDAEPFVRSFEIEQEIIAYFEDTRAKKIFRLLFEKLFPQELATDILSFLASMNKTAGLQNFFPKSHRSNLKNTFEKLRSDVISATERHDLMDELNEFRGQWATIINYAERHNYRKDVCNFFCICLREQKKFKKSVQTTHRMRQVMCIHTTHPLDNATISPHMEAKSEICHTTPWMVSYNNNIKIQYHTGNKITSYV